MGNLYDEMLKEASALNEQVRVYREFGELMCSLDLQEGFMRSMQVLEKQELLTCEQVQLLSAELKKR